MFFWVHPQPSSLLQYDMTIEGIVVDLFSQPWRIVLAVIVAYVLKSWMTNNYWTRPKKSSLPPFYMEYPYIPWLGSLVQFATSPREFLERAAMATKSSNCFTIQLFGKPMTFLTGSEGHAKFFKAPENVFDIREVCVKKSLLFVRMHSLAGKNVWLSSLVW